jgi:hypothetical protein
MQIGALGVPTSVGPATAFMTVGLHPLRRPA